MNTKKWASVLLLAGLTLGLSSCGGKENNEPKPTPNPVVTGTDGTYTISKVTVTPKEVTLDGIGKINLAEFNFGEAVLGTGKFTQVTLKDNKITFTGKQGTREYEVQYDAKKGTTIHSAKHGAMPFAPKVGSFSIKDGKLSGQLDFSMYIMYLNSYKTRYGKSPSDEITKILTALNKAETKSTIAFEAPSRSSQPHTLPLAKVRRHDAVPSGLNALHVCHSQDGMRGSIRPLREGAMNLYWSAGETTTGQQVKPLLVSEQTSTGPTANHYWSSQRPL